jgi:hypothetical protein
MKKIASLFLLCLLFTLFFNFASAQCPTSTHPDPDINNLCVPDNNNLPDPAGGVSQVIINVMMWLLGILGAVAIIGFVISGMQYLLSAGDDKVMATAKRNMLYCIVGIVVGLSGYIIIYAIDQALRGQTTW